MSLYQTFLRPALFSRVIMELFIALLIKVKIHNASYIQFCSSPQVILVNYRITRIPKQQQQTNQLVLTLIEYNLALS